MRLLLGTALFLFLGTASFADDLSISGSVQVGSNYIDFGVTSMGPYIPAPGYGDFQVTSVGAGSVFATAGVTANEMGSVQSLDESAGPVTLPSPFITFTGVGGATTPLTATSIPPGATGPFTLSDTANGAEAVFEVLGYVGTDTSDTFAAEFNMFFPGLTVAQLFIDLPQNTTYCANIEVGGAAPTLCDPFAQAAAAPEPAYTWLVAAGLLGAAFVGIESGRRKSPGQATV